MRLLFILVTIAVLSEAKKRRPVKRKKMNSTEVEIPHEADENPNKFVHVPFGHIYKEGFQPNSKQPVDLLELDLKYNDELRENMDMNLKTNQRERPKGFASPKDSFYFGEKEPPVEDKEIESSVQAEKNDSSKERQTWLDLAGIHARNLAMTRRRNPTYEAPQTRNDSDLTDQPEDTAYRAKERFLSRSSFNLEHHRQELKPYNWTTCDEFGRNADFHPKDVINIDWVPFYTWSSDEIQRTAAFVHRFTYPTVKLVKKYKEDIGPYLNKTLDWEGPKLYLKSDVEMLLVAVDRKGEFDGIPFNEVPNSMKKKKITLPMVNLRLKIVDPHLAMMFCEYQYATIMAVSGNEPKTIREIRSEAATLKFKGRGYPVARDLEAERLAAKYERDRKIDKERDRFIEVEDQADTGFPFEL